jgi:hypothetical protein
VSSILKALQKAEKESPRLEVSPELPTKIDTKRAVNQRARGTWLFRRVLTTVVVILVAGIGAWFVLGSKDLWVPKEIPVPSPASKAPAETRVASPESDDRGTAGEARQEIPREPAPKALAPSGEKGARVEPVRKDESGPVRPQGRTQKPAEAENNRRQSVAVSSPAQVQGDESRYKLEAIVWSNNAESRFAVINGQIVRTGGAVGGLSVLEIGRDHVEVRSGSRAWKMRFTVE